VSNEPDQAALERGYVNYFDVLGVATDAKPGEVRKVYRRKMKDLLNEINRVEVTARLKSQYLLEMAKLNAALYILRDTDERDAYWQERQALMQLEARWRDAADAGSDRSRTNGPGIRPTGSGVAF
jgi:DnaJ-class molecular chaperone